MHECFSRLSSHLPSFRVAAFLLALLPTVVSIASAAALSDDFEESEFSGRERAGVMSEYITPECEDCEDVREDYYD